MAKNKYKITIKKALDAFIIGVIAIVVLIAAIYYLPYMPKVKNTIADSGDNISGWAWDSAIGWISFNNTNIDGSTVAYGVNLDSSSGDFTDGSYAWNPSIGWLDFNPIESTPAISTGDDYNYPVEFVGGELRGWAKFSSMPAGSGWVRFHPDPSDDLYGDWGVELASEEECSEDGGIGLKGYAWSSDFGWISFNGSALDESEFGVYLSATPNIPSNVNAVPSISSPCSAISISWTYSGCGADGFEVRRKTTDSAWNAVCSVGADSFGCVDAGLAIGEKYFYQVRTLGKCENSDWAASGEATTYSVCDFPFGPPSGPEWANPILARGQCPSSAVISWFAPSAADSAVLEYSVSRKEVKDENGNVILDTFWTSPSSGTCSANLASLGCIDAISGDASGKKTYIYKVKAMDISTGDFIEAESNEIVPCPSMPTWMER